MHKCLKFINYGENIVSKDLSTMTKEIGNATRDTIMTFEYEIKSK